METTKLVRTLLGDGMYKLLGFIEMIFKDIFKKSFPPSICNFKREVWLNCLWVTIFERAWLLMQKPNGVGSAGMVIFSRYIPSVTVVKISPKTDHFLHETLAAKAYSLTLNALYFYHPHNEIDFEIKEIMDITISNWYTEYCSSYLPENHQAESWDLDYPLLSCYLW